MTREAILVAARKAFARKGYSATSVTDITEGLHVGRANFYYYFRDKKELFIELGTATYRELQTVIDSFGGLGPQPECAEVHSWVEEYFGYLERNGAFIARSMDDLPDDEQFRANVKRLQKRSGLRLGRFVCARSTSTFSSPTAVGQSIMAMLDRSWVLAETAERTLTTRTIAEILVQTMR